MSGSVCCKKGHTLHRNYRLLGWTCDGAREHGGCRSGVVVESEKRRYRCDPCNFDYCGPCYDLGLNGVRSFVPGVTCNRGHNCSVSSVTGSWSCDLCRKDGSPGVARWRCNTCNFDACIACRPVIAASNANSSTPENTTKFVLTIPNGVTSGMKFHARVNNQELDLICPANSGPGDKLSFTLSDASTIPPPNDSQSDIYEVEIPPNLKPGDEFAMIVGGKRTVIKCPPNAVGGQKFRFSVPKSQVSELNSSKSIRFNRVPLPISLGSSKNGVDCSHLYYCSRTLGRDKIPGSNGQCGPTNGPQCADCSGITSSSHFNRAGFLMTKSSSCATYYCSRTLGRDMIPGSNGQCGPQNGPQCSDCRAVLPAPLISSSSTSSTSTSSSLSSSSSSATSALIPSLLPSPPPLLPTSSINQSNANTDLIDCEVIVPNTVAPGQKFFAEVFGVKYSVECPLNARPGSKIGIKIPNPSSNPETRASLPRPPSLLPAPTTISEPEFLNCEAVIPNNIAPGQKFNVLVNGSPFAVQCPLNAGPGTKITIKIPNSKYEPPNSKKSIAEFVQTKNESAIPTMSRMLLVERSITDINVKDTSNSSHFTALNFQIRCGTKEAADWLLRQNPPADIETRDKSGNSPLINAVLANHDSEGKVRLLLDYGADRSVVSHNGNTALYTAMLHQKPAVITLLQNYFPDTRRLAAERYEIARIESAKLEEARKVAAKIEEARQLEERLEREKAAVIEKVERDKAAKLMEENNLRLNKKYAKEDKYISENLKMASSIVSGKNNYFSSNGISFPKVSGARFGGILIQGNLMRKKKGTFAFGKWTTSYFVLYEDSLQYYEKDADFKEGRPPKEIITIGNCSSSAGGTIDLGNMTYYLISISQDSKSSWYPGKLIGIVKEKQSTDKDVYNIACSTEAEKDAWLHYLTVRCKRGQLSFKGPMLHFDTDSTITNPIPEPILLSGWSTSDGKSSYRAIPTDYFPFDPHAMAPNQKYRYLLICETAEEAIEWIVKVREVRNGTKLLYLSTLLKVKTEYIPSANSFQCGFVFGSMDSRSQTVPIRKEWRLTLNYQELLYMYNSLSAHFKKGLISGAAFYWSDFSFPTEGQLATDMRCIESMRLFLEQLIKTYPYTREVWTILKLDTEFLPFLDIANQSCSNGLRLMAENLANGSDSPCGSVVEFFYLITSLLEFRNQIRLNEDSAGAAGNGGGGSFSIKRGVKVEDLIESCQLLANSKKLLIEAINSHDAIEADKQLQLMKYINELEYTLLMARDSDTSHIQRFKDLAPILLEPNISLNEVILNAIDSWLTRNFDSFGVESSIKLPMSIKNATLNSKLNSSRESLSSSGSTALSSTVPRPQQRDIMVIDWANVFIPDEDLDDDSCIIGSGTFGTVFKAKVNTSSLLPIDVAVKVLVCDNKTDFTAFSENCRKEVDNLLDIENKLGPQSSDRMIHVIGIASGILPPYFTNVGVGKKKKGYGIIMRLEAGGSLDVYLDTKAKMLRVVDKLRILLHLSRSLAEMHDKGIIHGDIKPKNILLSEHNPPIPRYGDFGGSIIRDQLPDYLGMSTMMNTTNKYGTLYYNAPEMLKSNAGLRAKPSRKTDIYAFSIVCWEVLCKDHKVPFSDAKIVDELHLVEVVSNGRRPDLSALHPETPDSMRRMIEKCWDANRSARPCALECYTRIDQCYNTLNKSTYDIFFSHPWKKKSVLRHAKRYLTSLGYKVWYDQDDMQWDLVRSMKEGVEMSKVVLACISKEYENSKNCMLELSQACQLADKPIITLSTDANPFAWAGSNTSHGDLKQMCGISGQGKLFFDIGEICSRPGWDDPDDEKIPAEDISDLNTELEKIVKLLRGSQINCHPSL